MIAAKKATAANPLQQSIVIWKIWWVERPHQTSSFSGVEQNSCGSIVSWLSLGQRRKKCARHHLRKSEEATSGMYQNREETTLWTWMPITLETLIDWLILWVHVLTTVYEHVLFKFCILWCSFWLNGSTNSINHKIVLVFWFGLLPVKQFLNNTSLCDK